MKVLLGLGLLLGAVPLSGALAEDRAACGKGLICASDPQTVVKALQEAGYKAKLTADKLGDPMVESAASGYEFEILFYGCESKRRCDSLQFYRGFEAGVENTPAYANKWNVKNRFVQMAAHPDTTLSVHHDVSTIGGLTKANFADTVEWWASQLNEMRTFFRENDPAKPTAARAGPTAN